MRLTIFPALIVISASFSFSRPLGNSEDLYPRTLGSDKLPVVNYAGPEYSNNESSGSRYVVPVLNNSHGIKFCS